MGREGADFSFSGLKTAVRQVVQERGPLGETGRADLAADFQAAVVDVLIDRVRSAMQQFRTEFGNTSVVFTLVAAGGVAANRAIRAALQQRLRAGRIFALPVRPLSSARTMARWSPGPVWSGLRERVKRSARQPAPRPLAAGIASSFSIITNGTNIRRRRRDQHSGQDPDAQGSDFLALDGMDATQLGNHDSLHCNATMRFAYAI